MKAILVCTLIVSLAAYSEEKEKGKQDLVGTWQAYNTSGGKIDLIYKFINDKTLIVKGAASDYKEQQFKYSTISFPEFWDIKIYANIDDRDSLIIRNLIKFDHENSLRLQTISTNAKDPEWEKEDGSNTGVLERE